MCRAVAREAGPHKNKREKNLPRFERGGSKWCDRRVSSILVGVGGTGVVSSVGVGYGVVVAYGDLKAR
jgi:hypothetical protein